MKTRAFQIGILLIAAMFIGLGIIRGEHTVLLSKAIRICLTCIGLG